MGRSLWALTCAVGCGVLWLAGCAATHHRTPEQEAYYVRAIEADRRAQEQHGGPEEDFATVRQTDTLEAYQDYLFRHHKTDAHYDEAFARLDALLHPGGRAVQNLHPADIIVTTGSLSQSYKGLSTVEADTTDILLSGADLNDALFRPRIAVAIQGHSPKLSTAQMDERLRSVAQQRYGGRVDAVINVTYRTNYDGHVFASGLAVHFLEQQSAPVPAPTTATRSLEDRLKELRELREKNLITPEEYYEKRSEMLKEL